MTVIVPMAVLRGRVKAWKMPINWTIVLAGNLAGCLCCAVLMGESRRREDADIRVSCRAVQYGAACSVFTTRRPGQGEQTVWGDGPARDWV